MKIVIVGGVAGGATAMARLRRLDENAEIVLFERGKYISFANCGLPYYVGGAIGSRDALFVSTKEEFERIMGLTSALKAKSFALTRQTRRSMSMIAPTINTTPKHTTSFYFQPVPSPSCPRCRAQITPTFFSCGRSLT